MRDFTIDNLTDIVIEEYAGHTPDPRMRTIMTSLLTHLHGFIKDVELTEQEWFEAIQFLTATGQICSDTRQEFILLSDTLGVSMLVDAINHPKSGHGTESTVLGPFYVEGAPEMASGANVIRKDMGGEVTLVRGTVTDPDGQPIAGATLDIWSTAANSLYDVQDAEQPAFNLRGKFTTSDDGSFSFITEKPVPYPVPTDGPVGRMLDACGRHAMRPAHLHFIISADGYQPLTTHVFVAGDPYLDSDAVFATKSSLIADVQTVDDAELADCYGITVPFNAIDFKFGLMPAR